MKMHALENSGPRRFLYEDAWQREESYDSAVNEGWVHAAGDFCLRDLNTNLIHMQSHLTDWKTKKFGDVRRKIKKVRREFEKEKGSSLYRGSSPREKELARQLNELLHREEIMAQQRSRVDWLRAGDRNTGFFHAQSTARRTRNRISALEDANGVLCETKEAIHAVVQQFYTNLYSAQEELVVDEVLHHVPVKVTEQMNDRLMRPFSAEEIDKALFAMAPLKAPGEDGFNAGFYQRHWNLIREDVTRAVLNFLNGGHMPEVVNKTVIVLIPKVKNPRNITQYRPISLCNVIYKICSKVLANRLREILDEIISEEQSAFVPGRLITDNVIMAYECIHAMRRKKGKQGWCAVKIDMMKAYDHVEWEYLQGVMLQLGFSEDWVSLVMKCVNSVSFQVKVNGELLPSFKPSRGFRQGDPISPYLFLLCGEGLSCMLKNYDGGWIDRGIRAGLRSPWVSHLLFADDCLVFMKADSRSATRLNEILQAYSHGSGQSANKQKSSVFFSPNCGASTRRVVQNILQIQREAMTEKYLGLPTAAGRITERILNTLWSQLDQGYKDGVIGMFLVQERKYISSR